MFSDPGLLMIVQYSQTYGIAMEAKVSGSAGVNVNAVILSDNLSVSGSVTLKHDVTTSAQKQQQRD